VTPVATVFIFIAMFLIVWSFLTVTQLRGEVSELTEWVRKLDKEIDRLRERM
jgi:hypothetical protein